MDILPSTSSSPPCCGCGATRFTSLYRAPAFDATAATVFTLACCADCGLTRTEPHLTEQELGRYYAADYYGGGQRKFTDLVEWFTRLENQRRARHLIALLRARAPTGPTPMRWRILDIGCGRAHLLTALAQQGCECHGVERQEFPAHTARPDLHIYHVALDHAPLAAESFDAVVFWHTLEHMSDPAAILQAAVHLTRPGGIVALAVPNFGSWQAMLFKGAWFHLDLPRHTHHFSLPALRRLLENCGLRPFKTSTWAFDQNVFGFIQSLFNLLAPPRQINAFYGLLKNSQGPGAKGRLLCWLAAAGLIAPLALMDYLVAGLLKRGATLVIYAQKSLRVQRDQA